jgi:hypothetical protein
MEASISSVGHKNMQSIALAVAACEEVMKQIMKNAGAAPPTATKETVVMVCRTAERKSNLADHLLRRKLETDQSLDGFQAAASLAEYPNLIEIQSPRLLR